MTIDRFIVIFKDRVSSDEISKYVAELVAEGGSFCIWIRLDDID